MITLKDIQNPTGMANVMLTLSLIDELTRLGVIDAAAKMRVFDNGLYALEQVAETEHDPHLQEVYRAARIILEGAFPVKEFPR